MITLELSWLDWVLAFTAALVVGVSKAGVKGIAIIIVTLMAIVFGGKASTGILLPLLTVGDIFAVWYYHRHTQWKYLWRLLPWMVAGVLMGVWIGKDLPEATFKQGMAGIILLTVLMMFWYDRQKNLKVPDNWWFGGIMGLAAGFTTMVGNLAGAFSNLYFLAMRLPKDEFIGTAAWLFFIINLFKLPFHIFVWETITWESLAVDLRLAPGVLVGLLLGIFLVKKIKDHHYRQMILILTALGALVILTR